MYQCFTIIENVNCKTDIVNLCAYTVYLNLVYNCVYLKDHETETNIFCKPQDIFSIPIGQSVYGLSKLCSNEKYIM